MNLRTWVRRALRWSSAFVPSPESDRRRLPADVRKQMDAWLAAFEAGRLNPPRDIHNRDAWDEYWRNHLEVGAPDQGLSDLMSSDATLPDLLGKRGSRTILCAGNGMSFEALSLALHGFAVTTLDISGVPSEVFRATLHDPAHPLSRIPGFTVHEDGSVAFGAPGSIDPELCPTMHRSEDYPPRGGGSLSFVTGDLVDAVVCPGPFDVVVERRTLQLFAQDEQLVALDRLVARLSNRGVFVSQQHSGCWKPGEDRTHFASAWLASHGFVTRSETASDTSDAMRLACLTFSSG